MKALRWYGRRDLRYEDAPEPEPAPGQVKIRVKLAGICGTDLKEYADGPLMLAPERAPVTLGHEFVGTVAAVGEGVGGFRPGDRVSGVGYYYCGQCYACREGRYNLCLNQGFTGLTTDGCMAEYFVLPAYAAYNLPDNVSDDMGALVEPLAVALHAVSQGSVQPGDSVAVVGDGAIGLGVLLAARAAGAGKIYLIAKHRGRGELAARLGADAVIYLDEGDPAEKVHRLTGGEGARVTIECVGRPETPQLALNLTRRRGSVVLVGVFARPGTIDFSTMTFTEINMVGSSIYIGEGAEAVSLMAEGRLDPTPLVTSRVPLKDAASGFAALLADKDANIKVLLSLP